jgi:hypothetical protein
MDSIMERESGWLGLITGQMRGNHIMNNKDTITIIASNKGVNLVLYGFWRKLNIPRINKG